MPTARTVALGYIRLSSYARGDPTDSPEQQRDTIAGYCRHKGWAVEWFEDAEEGRKHSGRTERRPGYQRMMRQLTRPDVAAVVIRDLFRINRNLLDFLNLNRRLEQHGVALVSVHQHLDTSTPTGRMVASILMTFGQYEAEATSERLRWMIAHRRAAGLHWGPVPFGYERYRGELRPGEDAATLRLIFDMYATGDWSYKRLAAWLNDRGHSMCGNSNQRRPFTCSDLSRLTNNHWLYRGWLVPDEWAELQPPPDAQRGAWQPLIPDELGEQVVAVKARHAAGHERHQAKGYYHLLVPILFCGHCGARLVGHRTDAGDRHWRYYAHPGRGCPAFYGAPVDIIERQVLGAFTEFVSTDDWVDRIRAADAPPADAFDLAAERARLEGRLTRLRDLYRLADIELDDYMTERARLHGELEALRSRAEPAGLGDLGDVVTLLRELAREADRVDLRRAVQMLYQRVDVFKGPDGWRALPQPRPPFV